MQEAIGVIPKNTPTTIKKAQNPQIKRRQYRQVRESEKDNENYNNEKMAMNIIGLNKRTSRYLQRKKTRG